jgi:hypothetical protein
MKTIIKYFDWAGQTLLMLTGLIAMISNLDKSDGIFVVLWVQLVLGPWQVLSAIIWSIWEMSHQESRKHYLIAALSWVAILIFLPDTHPAFNGHVMIIIGAIIIPWMLAFYYYRIVWRSTFIKASGKGFLPHLQF